MSTFAQAAFARRALAVIVALTAGSLAAAGCGSADESSADKPAKSVAQAKAELSTSCQQGVASDKPLCDCIGNKLQAAGKTAQQIAELDDRENKGEEPAEISKASKDCAAKVAGCLGNKLRARGKTDQQIVELVDRVDQGEEPAALSKAAKDCAR